MLKIPNNFFVVYIYRSACLVCIDNKHILLRFDKTLERVPGLVAHEKRLAFFSVLNKHSY